MLSRKYRHLTLLCGLLMAFALLAVACGDDDDDDDDSSGDTPTSTATDGDTATASEGSPTASGTSEATGTEEEQTEDFGSLDVLGVWGGGGEQESFEAVVAPWEDETGGEVDYTGTRDLTQQLTLRVEGDNPPDVAFPPEVGTMQQFAAQGDIQPLSQCPGLEEVIRENYNQNFIDLGSVDGELYGIVFKVDSKGTIFYNPEFFTENGLEPLTTDSTWDDLMALATQARDEAGVPPFSMGVESDAATGWVITDWIAQIFLAEAGIDAYNGIVSGEVPFNDPAMLDAWQKLGQIVHGDGMVLQGDGAGILATGVNPSTYPPFESPPEAAMVYLGAFGLGFITEQFPDIVPGEQVDVMPFPGGAITGGFNVAYMFNADPATCSFMEYIAGADAQQIWVERGGFTSANNGVDIEGYPDAVSRTVAEQVLQAESFAGDMDDLVGGQFQQAFWAAAIQYLQSPDSLEELLASVESARGQPAAE